MYFASTTSITTIFFISVYMVLFLYNNVIYVFLLYEYSFSLHVQESFLQQYSFQHN
jgi:hypothetical protein